MTTPDPCCSACVQGSWPDDTAQLLEDTRPRVVLTSKRLIIKPIPITPEIRKALEQDGAQIMQRHVEGLMRALR